MWQVLNWCFLKKCILEIVASWIPLLFGVLGLDSLWVKFLAHAGCLTHANFFSSSSLHVHDLAGLVSRILSLWNGDWNSPLLAFFWHASRIGYLLSVSVSTTDSTLLQFALGWWGSPNSRGGRRPGHHGISKSQENNAQGPGRWATITNTTLERQEAAGQVRCYLKKRHCACGSDQKWFTSNKHSLNIHYVPDPVQDAFNVSFFVF